MNRSVKSVFHFPGIETLKFIVKLIGSAKISRVIVEHVPLDSVSIGLMKSLYGAKSIKFELK